MYLPYGVNDQGQLVYIEYVARGKTGLKCPYCGIPLIARKGERIAPHFAHDGVTCREVKRSSDTLELPVYDSFRLHLSGQMWERLRLFHDEEDTSGCDWLEEDGWVKSFMSPYGNHRYNLTHKGKIPFGDLSLNLFIQFQEPLIQARHDQLERTALAALCTAQENTSLTDLRVFRAQMRRILETTLYFIEVRTGEGILHKIGVTTRSLEQRMAEIRADLSPHFGSVELIPLGTWAHRGNVELYFKYRYRRFQYPIGTLTEYFAFEDVKAIRRDLRRMTTKKPNETEQAILAGIPSRVEQAQLLPHELLSEEAWQQLVAFSSDELKHRFDARLELHNYRLGGYPHPLVEFASSYPELRLEVTEYGQIYRERFAHHYCELYATRAGSSNKLT